MKYSRNGGSDERLGRTNISVMTLPNCGIGYISEQDYLEGEKVGTIKHEYIDGEVYAMAGASKNHQRIVTMLSRRFSEHFDNTPCEVFSSDIKVHIDSKYFYPDVVVVCSNDDNDSYCTESPRIIIEILSSSTRKNDRTFILRTGIILRFWSPTPTLPHWEREFMKSADYASSQYKRYIYQTIPSLEEYVLIEQDFVQIELYCELA